MKLHPTLTLWEREEEDGSYKATFGEDWEAHVHWKPAEGEKRRGFWWKVKGPEDASAEADEPSEEIEHAMAYAEQAAKARGAKVEAPAEDEG